MRPRLEKPKKNFIDRAIEFVAPVWAGERYRARMAMASADAYLGASRRRRQTLNWDPSSGDADTDLDGSFEDLRDRSRDLYRNNSWARAAINDVTRNVVGPGIRVQSRVQRDILGLTDEEAEEFQRGAESEFWIWANSTACDARDQLTFEGIQRLAFLSHLRDGDIVVLKQYPSAEKREVFDLRLRLVEGDRLSNPDDRQNTESLRFGVEYDERGRPKILHIADSHPGDATTTTRRWSRVRVRGEKSGERMALLLFEPGRVGQSRGEPFLTPVIENLKHLGKYTESELDTAVVSSCFTAFITTQFGDGLQAQRTTASDDDSTGARTNNFEMDSGAILDLLPGEDVKFADPNRPNSGFEVFERAMLRGLGACLGIPYEVLVKHFQSSYSASRAALLDAWKLYRAYRAFLIRTLCPFAYEGVLVEAIAKGRLKAPGFFGSPRIRAAYLRADWIGPSPGQIDPTKEVEAANMLVDGGYSTRTEQTAYLTGGDHEANLDQLSRERSMAERKGVSIGGGSQPTKSQDTSAQQQDAMERMAAG